MARSDAFGDAVDEQIGDVIFAEVPGRELLIVRPQPLADLRHRRARQQQPAALVLEGVLDVAHAETARQKLDRQVLERLGAPLQMVADLGAERLVAPRDLRRRIVDQTFRRLQPTGSGTVPVSLAGHRAVLVVVPPDGVAALRFQSLLDD